MRRTFLAAGVGLAIGHGGVAYGMGWNLGRPSIAIAEISELLQAHHKVFTGGSFLDSHSVLYFGGGTAGVNALLGDLAKVEGVKIRVRFSTMRLPRMTTRRWMTAVVVIGLMMGGIVGGVWLRHRHDHLRSRAQYNSEMEIACRRHRKAVETAISYGTSLIERAEQERGRCSLESPGSSDSPILKSVKAEMPRLREDLAREDQEIPYYAAMARKYRHAAHYPWLPVKPDPPDPGHKGFLV